MKNNLLFRNLKQIIMFFCFLFFVLLTSNGYSQIAAWQLYGAGGDETTVSATTINANLNNSLLSRGSGLTASALGNAYSSTNFNASGTKANAITNNKFVYFTLNAKAGYQVSLSTLDVNFRRSGSGPNAFRWEYSTGSSYTDIGDSDISYTATTTGGNAQTQISLSSIPALQNVPSGTTITIRLLCWGATATTGTFAIGRSTTTGATDYSLSIGGTVTSDTSVPIVSTTTANPIGTTMATLGGNVTNDGGDAVTGRGVVYAATLTNNNPIIFGTGVTNSSTSGTTGAFSVSETSLSVNTSYSYRAYATNSIGTGYG